MNLNNHIKCTKCASDQITTHKHGFDVSKAIFNFICVYVGLAILWACLIQYQNTNNDIDKQVENETHTNELLHEYSGKEIPQPLDYGNNKFLWAGTIAFLGLSLLSGFKDANKIDVVCLSCGNVQDIEKTK